VTATMPQPYVLPFRARTRRKHPSDFGPDAGFKPDKPSMVVLAQTTGRTQQILDRANALMADGAPSIARAWLGTRHPHQKPFIRLV